MDKMTIVGKDGKPRYIVSDTQIQDVRACTCKTSLPEDVKQDDGLHCQACGGLIEFQENL